MAAPKIVSVPSRGAYSVKGTPAGITIPKAPVAGSQVRGERGVTFVYRPGGPKGAGYYKKPKAAKAAATTGTNASGATIATPPPPPAATPGYDYSKGFSADPRYAPGMASIAANQAGIGTEYGLVINRDTDTASPTYGMAKFRAPGEAAGSGTILAKIDPITGKSVYSDASGKVYSVADLTLDVRELKPGEAGYLSGALGNAAATSANNQQTVGQNAALAGVQRSGMRASSSLMETNALQGALSKLGLGAAGAFRGTTDQYANLLNAIYPDQADKATALASVGTPTPPAPVVTPALAAPNTNPTTQTGLVAGQKLSGGPKGQFMGQVGAILVIRDMSPKDRIQQLRAFAREYALTPEQKKYVALQIKKLGGK